VRTALFDESKWISFPRGGIPGKRAGSAAVELAARRQILTIKVRRTRLGNQIAVKRSARTMKE